MSKKTTKTEEKKKPDTITFRPTSAARSLIDRVQKRDGIEFRARVINRAILLAYRDMLSKSEAAEPKIAVILAKHA